MSKKDDGGKRKAKRNASKVTLTSLVGKFVKSMTKAEQEALIIVLGQMLDILDDKGAVKTL